MTAFSGPTAESSGATANHPLALRMCIIAFLSYNITLACMHGTYSVFVGAVEEKLGVTRDLSTLGISLLMLSLTISSPIAGVLATKFSIRKLFLLGGVMNLLTYVVLALSTSIYVNLAAYALLAGPGICLTATVLPPTLITRWFNVNRGRALGFTTMPIILGIVPPIAALVLRAYGLSTTYWLLAAVIAVLLVALFFIVDYPPDAMGRSDEEAAAGRAADPGTPVAQLLRSGRFWTLSLAAAAIMSSAIVTSAHLVPMAASWGIDPTRAATMLTASAWIGIFGAVAFGWLADRLGGATTMALLCFDSAILWAIVLLHPTFSVALPVVALLSFHGAAVVPSFSMALSQQFGQAGFSRAFGMGMVVALPFNVGGVPIAARIYMNTGSYAQAIMVLIAFFLVGGVLALTARIPNYKA